MRIKLPPCPNPECGELDLYLRRMGDTFEVRCADCGWTTGVVTLGMGQDMADVIAAAVGVAQAIDSQGKNV